MKKKNFEELLLQSLEHERGGVLVYRAALECAVTRELAGEWKKYLEQTRRHVTALEGVCKKLKIDPERTTPGRAVVRHLGASLVQAMKMARESGDANAAEIVACECVVIAETKDHADWQLLGKCAKELEGAAAEALRAAYEEIEDEEDEHLYHVRGWCRELWVRALGLPAMIPPPEEKQKVRTAIGAARAEQMAELSRVVARR